MLTTDDLVKKIVNFKFDEVKRLLPSRDIRVIIGLSKAMQSSNYITENQSRLLLKILNNHRDQIQPLHEEISDVLQVPTWNKSFRRIEQKKLLKITKDVHGDSYLTIEVFYAGEIKEFLQQLMKQLSDIHPSTTPGTFRFPFTEKNIVLAVEVLSGKKFEIDADILDHYNVIKSWGRDEIESQFLITSMTNQNFQKMVSDEIGAIEPLDKNIINDRRLRYQYSSDFYEENPKNLTEIIANRTHEHCWVDSNEHTLDAVFDSMQALQRMPILLIFDSYDQAHCLKNLQILSEIFEKNGITEEIGIYFRLQNNDTGKKFNQLIAEKKYNYPLSATTKIAAIQNGKIPKFFLKNTWTPMSVISLGNILKYNKTGVFASNCDLIVSYTNTKPMEPVRPKWR